MVKTPFELEAGSPYSIKVQELDSAVRFAYLIIEKAKKTIKLLKQDKWDEAKKDILQILRVLNRNDLNFQHIRQMIYSRKLENQLTGELQRIAKDGGRLIGDYKKIQRSKNLSEYSNFKKDAESLLIDIIKQENLLEKVLNSFKHQVRRSEGVFFAGINAGGTSTRCVIVDKDGNMLGYGKAGPAFLYSVGFIKAVENILISFRRAAEAANLNPKKIYVQRIVVGLMLDLKSIHLRYSKIFTTYIKRFSPNIKDVVLLLDTLVAWYTGLGGAPGILVLGGTGTYIYGYNKGKESNHIAHHKKVGEREMSVLGGRHISFHAAKVLRKLIKSRGKSASKSIMLRLLQDAFNKKQLFPNSSSLLEALEDMDKGYPANIPYYGKLTREETAMLAPYIIEAAKLGDKLAIELIVDSTKNQCFLISQVANDIGLHNKPFKVTYTGSFVATPFVLHHIKKELNAFEPYAEVIKPVLGDEMDGLLLIARKNIHFY